MVYEIKKYDRGDIELLPDIIETPLWEMIDKPGKRLPAEKIRPIDFLPI